MRFFCLFYFWLMVFLFVMQIIELGVTKYPKERKPISLGSAVALAIINLGMALWVGIVLWVLPRVQ